MEKKIAAVCVFFYRSIQCRCISASHAHTCSAPAGNESELMLQNRVQHLGVPRCRHTLQQAGEAGEVTGLNVPWETAQVSFQYQSEDSHVDPPLPPREREKARLLRRISERSGLYLSARQTFNSHQEGGQSGSSPSNLVCCVG